LGLAQELRILQMLIRLSHKSLVAQLRRHWQGSRPDLVVSLVPNFNRAMYQALAWRAADPVRDHLTDSPTSRRTFGSNPTKHSTSSAGRRARSRRRRP